MHRRDGADESMWHEHVTCGPRVGLEPYLVGAPDSVIEWVYEVDDPVVRRRRAQHYHQSVRSQQRKEFFGLDRVGCNMSRPVYTFGYP
jgi:hypothetical protein